MGDFFSSSGPSFSQVGVWPGIKKIQKGLTGTLSPYIPGIGAGLGESMDLFRRTAGGEFLDVTQDPNLMAAINAALGPAANLFSEQQQRLATPFIKSGMTWSSPRAAAQTELAGDQSKQLADMLWGMILPVSQTRSAQQYAAAEVPMNLVSLFTNLGSAGGGTPVQTSAGSASPFSKMLQLALAAYGMGWNPFGSAG